MRGGFGRGGVEAWKRACLLGVAPGGRRVDFDLAEVAWVVLRGAVVVIWAGVVVLLSGLTGCTCRYDFRMATPLDCGAVCVGSTALRCSWESEEWGSWTLG